MDRRKKFKYQSRVKILRWPTFYSPKTLRWHRIPREMDFKAKMVWILGHLRVSGLKKVGHPRILTRDWYFEPKFKNGSNFGPSQDFLLMPSRVNISFDDFLTISLYSPYSTYRKKDTICMISWFVLIQNIWLYSNEIWAYIKRTLFRFWTYHFVIYPNWIIELVSWYAT